MDVAGRHMGDLARGGQRWDVYLETVRDAELGAVRGRMHFVGSGETRSTAWIFLEWQEHDIDARFGELSPLELWNFVEALGPTVAG